MRPPHEIYGRPVTATDTRPVGRLGDWLVRAIGALALLAGAFAVFVLLVHLRITGG